MYEGVGRKKEREMSDLLRILVAGQAGQKIKVRTKKRVDDHRSDFLWMSVGGGGLRKSYQT